MVMDIEQMADNTTNIKDQFLYTGFIDQDLENESGLGTYDFGETLVMISPLGTFYGYSTNGAVEEVIDQEAIDHLVDDYNTNPVELLMDIDHKSMRNPEERDTTAAGWIYGLVSVKDLGRLSGLYGKVKWTDVGRRLVESRQYRFISPVFEVDEGRPVRIINAALTNRPALSTISPILNTTTNNNNSEVGENADKIDMTKEEVIELVKELLKKNSDATENACSGKKVKNADNDSIEIKKESIETKKEDEVIESKPKEESSKDNTEKTNNKVADDSTTTSNSDDVKEEKMEDDSEDEVIKEEVLNSAPTIGIDVGSSTKKWQNLHGAEFFKYIETHRNELM